MCVAGNPSPPYPRSQVLSPKPYFLLPAGRGVGL
jgi:hypothetical protein